MKAKRKKKEGKRLERDVETFKKRKVGGGWRACSEETRRGRQRKGTLTKGTARKGKVR